MTRADDHVFEVANLLDAAERPQDQFVRTLIDAPAGDLDVLGANGVANLIDGQAVGLKFVRIQPDLDLALPAADDLNRTDAANRFQPLLDLLVGNFGQFAKRPIAVDGNGKNRRSIEIDALDNRRVRIARQLADDGRNLVANFLRGDVGVLVEHELNDNDRNAFKGRRAQFLDAADRIDHFLDRFRDLRFDFFRACAGQIVRTVTVGRSILGNRSTPSCV